MALTKTTTRSRFRQGQTLVMALVIMGILMVLGLVFLGIISKNLRSISRFDQRTKAGDFSEAGIRYAHSNLLNSTEGADWRPVFTSLAAPNVDFTVDPDVLYLRPGTGLGLRNAADPQQDLGGPDGLGAYSRVNFEGGRSLIRVRYAPSDANIFSTDPQGSVRTPGKARTYLIIEAVGRVGAIRLNDPTTLPRTGGVKFRAYASDAEFRTELAKMREQERFFPQSKKLTAFVSIGIIESVRFITNKYSVSRDAELGVPDLGVAFEGQSVRVPLQLGAPTAMFDFGNPPIPSAGPISFGGGVWSNASLKIHGNIAAYLNYTLADMIAVNGSVLGADANAMLSLSRAKWSTVANAWQTTTTNLSNPLLDSRNPSWTTFGGVLRDSFAGTDPEGYPRAIARKEPPSILLTDPDTGLNRYVVLTRESGPLVGNGNSGRFGHGMGVYVNNTADRQLRSSEDQREDVGTAESLFYDWLNPNNPSGSWKGPYYVPRGAYMQLQRDGFLIIRDARAPNQERFWRRPDGATTNSTVIRYRVGPYDFDGDGVPDVSIVNTYTPGVNINAANPNFALGQPFNGVVYFEGNVRVRGIIPTDVQMTVVSNANIYVEGSITKGVVDASGNFLTRPSRSMLALLAKDYVALNTTQFVGPATQDVEEPNEQASAVAWNPIKMTEPGGVIGLRAEELLDPTSGVSPNLWTPYALSYREFNDPAPGSNTGPPISQGLVLSHTQENGAAPYSFISLDVNYGVPAASYLFELSSNNAATSFYPPGYVTPGYTTPGFAPVYGLGVETWQRYAKFESIGFPLVDQATAGYAAGNITVNGPMGRYTLFTQETSDFSFRTNNLGAATNSYYLARAALVPQDVRIEAVMYAEEGSFFVIPGQWFNPNPNDTRERYQGLGTTQAERDQARKEMFGSFPEMPFYGEPPDVRVTIVGAVSENMPPPIAQQAEWLKKWGWIPRLMGATGRLIPKTHVPNGYDIRNSGQDRWVPNLIFTYDPSLATARVGGFDNSASNPLIRTDKVGRALPPVPRLPVSPTLVFFGEVNP